MGKIYFNNRNLTKCNNKTCKKQLIFKLKEQIKALIYLCKIINKHKIKYHPISNKHKTLDLKNFLINQANNNP